MTALPLEDLLEHGPARWLLELSLGREDTQTYRFAEGREEVLDEAGEVYVYAEGLQRPDASFGALAAGEPVRVEILADVDWAELVAAGIPLEVCRVTLRRWIPGTTLERSLVHVRGDLVDPRYDRAGAPLGFAIVRERAARAQASTKPLGRVSSRTWPITATFTLDSRMEGASYPVVFGSPGARPGGTTVAVVPVPTVERKGLNVGNRVAISYDSIAATSVTLAQITQGTSTATRSVAIVQDLRGRRVSTATVGGTLSSADEGQRYYAGIPLLAGGGGGGIRSPRDAARGLRGAGEITRYVLERLTRIGLDSARFADVEQRMDDYASIDTWANGDIDWWSWLTGDLWPLLPVRRADGPDGVYLRWLNWAAEEHDTVYDLDADRRGVTRIPGVGSTGAPGANELTLQFAPARDSGRYLEEVVVTAEAGQLADPDLGESLTESRIVANPFARVAQSLFKLRQGRRSTDLVWDLATASRVAAGWVAAEAIPRRVLRYVVGAALESIPLWSPITVSDTELHLDGAVALLGDLTPRGDQIEASVVLLEHPQLRAVG